MTHVPIYLELVIRRPTNLLISQASPTADTKSDDPPATNSSTDPAEQQQQQPLNKHPIESKRLSNNLKRPSSILFEQITTGHNSPTTNARPPSDNQNKSPQRCVIAYFF